MTYRPDLKPDAYMEEHARMTKLLDKALPEIGTLENPGDPFVLITHHFTYESFHSRAITLDILLERTIKGEDPHLITTISWIIAHLKDEGYLSSHLISSVFQELFRRLRQEPPLEARSFARVIMLARTAGHSLWVPVSPSETAHTRSF